MDCEFKYVTQMFFQIFPKGNNKISYWNTVEYNLETVISVKLFGIWYWYLVHIIITILEIFLQRHQLCDTGKMITNYKMSYLNQQFNGHLVVCKMLYYV